MPEKKPNALKKKHGPLPTWGYLAAAGGGVILFLWWRNRQAAAAAASTPLTGGTTIPAGGTTTTGGTTTSSTPTTLAQWEEAALALVTTSNYSATAAYNDLTNWLSGQPVSTQGYNAIGNIISQLGLPPGIGSPGPVTVAPSAPTPPATGSSVLSPLASAIAAGETWFGNEGTNYVARGPGGAFVGLTNPQEAQQYASAGQTLYSYSPTGGFAPLSANQPNTVPGEFLQISSTPYGGVKG